jgi:hypothetical protein
MRFLKLGNLINILVFKIFLDFIVGEIINVLRSKSQIKKTNPILSLDLACLTTAPSWKTSTPLGPSTRSGTGTSPWPQNAGSLQVRKSAIQYLFSFLFDLDTSLYDIFNCSVEKIFYKISITIPYFLLK